MYFFITLLVKKRNKKSWRLYLINYKKINLCFDYILSFIVKYIKFSI